MQNASLQRRAAQRSGFTMVELLVVIGIIAILVAILVPALSVAKRASNLAQCSANLHQIGEGYLAYWNDSRGRLLQVDPQGLWDAQMAIGIWKDWKTARMQSIGEVPLTKSPLFPYIMDTSTAWICPSDPHGMPAPVAGGAMPYAWPPYPVPTDQAYYSVEGSSYWVNSWPAANSMRNVSRISNPAKFILAYDAPAWFVCDNSSAANWPTWMLTAGLPRWSFPDNIQPFVQARNRNNVVFFDGHVAMQTFIQGQWHGYTDMTWDGN